MVNRKSNRNRSNKHRRRRSQRNRRMRGGGQGAGWTMGGPLVPGLASDATVRQSYDACLGASRPGQIAFSQGGGLPGMSGQRGGAYTNNLNNNIAGFAQIDRDPTHCLPNHSNPMNNGSIQRGGGTSISVAASASPILEEHTARYTTAPSQWTGSTGAPILLNQPLNGVAWSKACTQTGGRRGRGRKNRKSRRRQYGGLPLPASYVAQPVNPQYMTLPNGSMPGWQKPQYMTLANGSIPRLSQQEQQALNQQRDAKFQANILRAAAE